MTKWYSTFYNNLQVPPGPQNPPKLFLPAETLAHNFASPWNTAVYCQEKQAWNNLKLSIRHLSSPCPLLPIPDYSDKSKSSCITNALEDDMLSIAQVTSCHHYRCRVYDEKIWNRGIRRTFPKPYLTLDDVILLLRQISTKIWTHVRGCHRHDYHPSGHCIHYIGWALETTWCIHLVQPRSMSHLSLLRWFAILPQPKRLRIETPFALKQ